MANIQSIKVASMITLAILSGLLIAAKKNNSVIKSLPQGFGLSAQYPGDQGIAKDSHVLFTENFNATDLIKILKRWSNTRNPKSSPMKLVTDSPSGLRHNRSLKITAIPSQNMGGHLYKKLDREVETMHARFYVKFPKKGHGYNHHFVHMGGYHPATNWPQGGAGERPRGDERVTVGIEPFGFSGKVKPPGLWNFYTYWHEMKISADRHYWGNALQPVEPQTVPVDRWQCVEVMMKLNTVGKKDGELALWLDGKLVAHIKKGVRRARWSGMGFKLVKEKGEPFEGFDFRTSKDLKLNFFWLLDYVTTTALKRNKVNDMDQPNIVLFDQIVVATRYIGPIKPMR